MGKPMDTKHIPETMREAASDLLGHTVALEYLLPQNETDATRAAQRVLESLIRSKGENLAMMVLGLSVDALGDLTTPPQSDDV